MCQNRHTPTTSYQPDRFFRGKLVSLYVGRAATADPKVECLVKTTDQPGFQQRRRHMWAPDRALPTRNFYDPIPFDGQSHAAQSGQHLLGPIPTGLLGAGQQGLELEVVEIYKVAKQVEFFPPAGGTDLDPWHDRNALPVRLSQGCGQSLGRVMVGDGQDLNAQACGSDD